MAFSTKLIYLLIPISCLGMVALSRLMFFLLTHELFYDYKLASSTAKISFYWINPFVILPISRSSLVFLAYFNLLLFKNVSIVELSID